MIDRDIAKIADIPDFAGDDVDVAALRPIERDRHLFGTHGEPGGISGLPLEIAVDLNDSARADCIEAHDTVAGCTDPSLDQVDVADEVGDIAGIGLFIDFGRRRHLHDAALVHDGDTVRYGHRLLLVM